MIESKTCPTCLEHKPSTEFGKNRSRSDGLAFYCKSCVRRADRERMADPVHREKNRLYSERLYREDPRRYLNYRYRARFGITLDRYEELERGQGGGCAICGGQSPDGSRLAVDHDHACCPGKKSCGSCVRGLLCSQCNRAIGLFKDNVALLSSAKDYLTG